MIATGSTSPPPVHGSHHPRSYAHAHAGPTMGIEQMAYRELVTAPKMAVAERYLAAHQLGPRCPAAARAAAVDLLASAGQRVDEVVPHIHDLWSEQVFRRAHARPSLRQNRFLKPLREFTDVERYFELTLATMDLRSMLSAAVEVFGLPPSLGPAPRPAAEPVLRALAGLCADRTYLGRVMRAIHRNWLEACRLHGLRDTGQTDYRRLDDAQRRELLANARADILAVLIDATEAPVSPSPTPVTLQGRTS
jgi:hypothetical protein